MGALGDHMRSRILLSYVGENCVQLYIQSIVLMLYAALSRMDGAQSDSRCRAYLQNLSQTLLSILVSCLMTLVKLSEAQAFFEVANDAMKKSDRKRPKEEQKKQDDANIARILMSVRIVKSACAVMVISLVMTAAKLVGTSMCESAMWNLLEVFSGDYGCVSVADLH